MNKLLIISGPTATGKTDLALSLAKQFNGELLSADSRQIYRGMDIGTGKDVGDAEFRIKNYELRIKNNNYNYGYYDLGGIPLWLVDVANPDQEFSVAHYREIALRTIKDIHKRGKLPILVGGTGLYSSTLLHPPETMHIPPDQLLRSELSHYDIQQLHQSLQSVDSRRLETMNQSDRQNPRRLIRAIEVANYRRDHKIEMLKSSFHADVLWTGLRLPLRELYVRIDQRVDKRIEQGILGEIKGLLEDYSWNNPGFSSLGYKEWKDYFEGKQSKEEAISIWKFAEHAYARRQMTYFRKYKEISWFDSNLPTCKTDVEALVSVWYSKRTHETN